MRAGVAVALFYDTLVSFCGRLKEHGTYATVTVAVGEPHTEAAPLDAAATANTCWMSVFHS